jgi:3-hydroxyisobutyrate dehydrogenase-like beta-hydroxyacid dehydrogenase
VDANSIAPERAREIAGLVEAAGAPFVSAAVHGSGNAFARTGQLFLSGRDVAPVAEAAEGALRVVRLGADPGSAKALKLLVAAMSKGLCALYLETGRAAARAGLLDEAEASLRHAYPAMMEDLDRMLPTYARHSARRTSELTALAEMEARLGVITEMADATLASVRRIPDELATVAPEGESAPWTARSLIQTLAGA